MKTRVRGGLLFMIKRYCQTENGKYFHLYDLKIFCPESNILCQKNNWLNYVNLKIEDIENKTYLSFLPETVKVATALFDNFSNYQDTNYKNRLKIDLSALLSCCSI